MLELELPMDPARAGELNAGDELLLCGGVLTMRDAALRRLEDLLRSGGEAPFGLEGQVVFHAGPTPPAAGRATGAVGPTTSARMDRYLEMLFGLGVTGTLGKGPRSEEAARLHEAFGTVYFAAVGGLGALYGGMVEEVQPVAWEDLGPEAVCRLTLSGFPALVAIDGRGRDYLEARRSRYGPKR